MSSGPPARSLPPATCTVRLEVDGDLLVAHLAGDLDLATAEDVEQLLLAAAARRPDRLVVDVRQLASCDVVGASALLRVRDAAVETATAVLVVGAPEPLVRLWCLLHLTAAGTGRALFEGASRGPGLPGPRAGSVHG